MRLICDANTLLSAILGVQRRPERLLRRGAQLFAVDVQVGEVASVLARFGREPAVVEALVEQVIVGIGIIDSVTLRSIEQTARGRLHPRGQPDWPTLAAAIELDAAIWSDDRDFFGVGVPVWSTWTLDRHPILTGTGNA